MSHLVKHEITCDFEDCDVVEKYEHDYDLGTCAIEHLYWPENWVLVTRSRYGKYRYCPLHSVAVGEDGRITISDEPDIKVGRFYDDYH